MRIRRIVLLFVSTLLGVLLISLVLIARRDAGPSAACRGQRDENPQPGSTTAHKLVSGGRERCYLLHIPAAFDPDEPLPLVITLHGLASNGNVIMQITDWNEIADREVFAVAYPDGSLFPLRWNTDARLNVQDVDDVEFMRALVEDIELVLPIDRDRVYASGFSNGGALAILIACRASDLIAAIGVVEVGAASVETLSDCSPSEPVPAIRYEGDGESLIFRRDRQVSSLAGWLLNVSTEPLEVPTPEEWAHYWAGLSGCVTSEEFTSLGGMVSSIAYTNCEAEASIELHIIAGMGHQWPGADPIPLLGESVESLNATERIWDFFKSRAQAAPH